MNWATIVLSVLAGWSIFAHVVAVFGEGFEQSNKGELRLIAAVIAFGFLALTL